MIRFDRDRHPSITGMLLIAVAGITAFSLCGTLFRQFSMTLGIESSKSFFAQILRTPGGGLHFFVIGALPFILATLASHMLISRRTVVGGIAAMAVLAIFGIGQWTTRLVDFTLCLVTFAAATGWGTLLLRLILDGKKAALPPEINAPRLRISERGLLTFILGMAAVSFLTAVAGMLGVGGISNHLAAAVVILPGVLLSISPLQAAWHFLAPSKISKKQKAKNGNHPGRFTPALIFSFLLTGTLLLLLNTRFPEMDYDVLEYHAQLPREYMDLGQIAFLPHNAFGGFPQAMEILTLLCGWMGGTIETGIGAAKLLHFSFLPLLLCGLYCLARRLGANKTAALLTGLPVLLLPMTSYLSTKLYVEFGLGAFMVSTLLVLRLHTIPLLRRALLAGVLAGAAAACKYPGVLLAIFPAMAVLFVDGTRAAFCSCIRAPVSPSKTRGLLAALFCGGTAIAVLSPWLVKNAVASGNPVYPLLADTIPTEYWGALQQERFTRAHRATSFSAGDMKSCTDRLFYSGTELGIACALLFPFTICGLFYLGNRKHRRRLLQAGWLLLWAGYGTVAWFYLTHRIDRFYWPTMLLLAGCCGLAVSWTQSVIRAGNLTRARIAPFCLWLPILGCWCAFVLFQSAWQASVASEAPNKLANIWDIQIGRVSADNMIPDHNSLLILSKQMKQLQQGSRLLLLGEAQPFWLPEPVDYAVVFSQHPLWTILKTARTTEDIRTALHERGVTHLYINWFELARLHATYYKAYELTPEQQRLLKSFILQCCTRMPFGSFGWNFQEAAGRNSYLATLGKDYAVLLGTTNATWSPIANAPYELFAIR